LLLKQCGLTDDFTRPDHIRYHFPSIIGGLYQFECARLDQIDRFGRLSLPKHVLPLRNLQLGGLEADLPECVGIKALEEWQIIQARHAAVVHQGSFRRFHTESHYKTKQNHML
jgi:hypothetical protein